MIKKKVTLEDALEYHRRKPAGKVSVVPTKPCVTQRDLSMAYTPGVAHPCLEIEKDPEKAYEYTSRGNLVAVISNGTAVLGLGAIGALAGKPVMEGKGVLFKRFADVDVFDIEVDTLDERKFIECVALLEPSFGGINLEDIKAPECFRIEEELKRRMKIPVFHDDQHGTAIISAAAFLNALEITGRKLDNVKVVFSGAGAAAVACANLYISFGLDRNNVLMVDRKGVIYKGRTEGMNEYKEAFAVETKARTLADALVGADVFVGLSEKGILTGEMVKTMAKDPIIFAMANPDPEITPEEALAARPDAIMATGRSDYPNQVNNVLGFPFIFRGALDCRATTINEAMKRAASKALAELAKEDVPDSVAKAYGVEGFKFGRDYLIPKPFDYRVLLRVPVAVARAAAESGVAKKPIADYEAYERELGNRLSRSRGVMQGVLAKAKKNPKRIVFPEGEHPKILRAAKILAEEGIAIPILLGRQERIAAKLKELELELPPIVTFIDAHVEDERSAEFAGKLHASRRRRGVTHEDAVKLLRDRNIYGSMMVETGQADGLVSGLTQSYPETIRPALQVIKTKPNTPKVAGLYMLVLRDRTIFFADTTVNIDPDPETLANIAIMSADTAKRFDIEPKVAFISYSNFGSNDDATTRKIREALRIAKAKRPDLALDGEMQADTAVMPEIIEEHYPWMSLGGPANVLVFSNLEAANAAYKLVWRLAEADAIGPILMGMKKPVHVLQRGVEVNDIVNMAAITVVDAQEHKD
jgi:malate dehydrogenase (oxaloacetate-decarboxylating)(NADP+)